MNQDTNLALTRFRDNINELRLTKTERENIQDIFQILVQAYESEITQLRTEVTQLKQKQDKK